MQAALPRRSCPAALLLSNFVDCHIISSDLGKGFQLHCLDFSDREEGFGAALQQMPPE
jgi:hypothetical protein